MINNWDIISSFDAKTQSQRFTLVIDGTEHDARLIAKKLAGYAKPPKPAVAPYVYSFELPSDLDEDTLRKIQNATKEGIEQARKVNEFVPGGILGDPLFNSDVSQEDKAFPTFLTLDPSESFFKAAGSAEIKENVGNSLELTNADVLDLQTQVFSGADFEPETENNHFALDTQTEEFVDFTPSSAAVGGADNRSAQTVAVPPEAAEEPEELAPAPKKPEAAPAKPVLRDVPPPSVPRKPVEPIDETPAKTHKLAETADLPKPVIRKHEPELEQPEMIAPENLTAESDVRPDAQENTEEQMPLEDIFSAETKYDMFLDLENQTLSKRSSKDSREKENPLSDDNLALKHTANHVEDSFKQPAPESAAKADNSQETTRRASRRNLKPLKKAPLNPEESPATEDTIQDPFDALMAGHKPVEKAKSKKPAAAPIIPETMPPLEPDPSSVPTEAEPAAEFLQTQRPHAGSLGKSIDLGEASAKGLSEEKNGEEPAAEVRKTILKKKVNKAQPPAAYTVEPAEALPDFMSKQKTERYVPSAKPAGQEPAVPPSGEEAVEKPLDRTFNLETTISAATMRRQYNKTFRADEDLDENLAQMANNVNPTMEPDAEGTFRLRRKKENQEAESFQLNKVGERMAEINGENNNELKNLEPEQPRTPKAPPPPPAPKPPMSAPQPPQASAHKPTAPRINNETLEGVTSSSTLIEQTKTIDHSIELPLSELKKHNWPLEIPLIPTFTLENMVMSVNRFAHATAISVIDNPGKLYNPLVLHGPPGTGKTHFLNAIGYALSKKFGQENIFITNGVRLSRGIQRYVMEGNIEKFETFVDSVKALLIDDIHLIAINEQNRVHISNLLNRFLNEQKQIIITSKYPPESLQKLEELIGFRLDSGWISELKPAQGAAHFRIVKKMLLDNGIDVSEAQMQRFFGSGHMTLGTVSRSIRRVKVLESLIFPHLPEADRSEAMVFEKLLATTGEDKTSAIKTHDIDDIKSIPITGNGEWGRIGFFYPQNNSDKINWLVFALSQRAKELGIPGGLELAVRSSYSTENIISSAFKIANLCDNKKLKGAVILGPSLRTCDPSVRENFYDILTHMLEVMLIRCGIINYEDIKSPSTYVKILSELLR